MAKERKEGRVETPAVAVDPHEYLQTEAQRWKNDPFTRIILDSLVDNFVQPMQFDPSTATGEKALIAHGIAVGAWSVIKALRDPVSMFKIADELKETFKDETEGN